MSKIILPIKVQTEHFKNPNYSEVLFLNSKQVRIPAKGKRDRAEKQKVEQAIRDSILKHKPTLYQTEKLFIAIQVLGSEKYFRAVDIDNLVKFLLDCMKGIIYKDDKQVHSLLADKTPASSNGFKIGIKVLGSNGMDRSLLFPLLPLLEPEDRWNGQKGDVKFIFPQGDSITVPQK
jgi:Holliday junction resolvase RusA-like endonuclease